MLCERSLDKQRLLSEACPCGKSLGHSEAKEGWYVLKQVRKQLDLSAHCLQVG